MDLLGNRAAAGRAATWRLSSFLASGLCCNDGNIIVRMYLYMLGEREKERGRGRNGHYRHPRGLSKYLALAKLCAILYFFMAGKLGRNESTNNVVVLARP